MIEPQFDNAYFYFSEGICFAEVDGKKGLIDCTGQFIVVLPDTINWIYDFSKGKSTVKFNNGNMNIIDIHGNYLLAEDYPNIEWNNDGEEVYYYIKDNHGRWLIANSDIDFIGEPADSVGGFSAHLCPVKYNDKWGYINSSGILTIDTIYDSAYRFYKDGIAIAKKDGIDVYINLKGDSLFSVDKTITSFHCNRAAVVKDGMQCLIDNEGRIICPVKANSIYDFCDEDSLATVIQNGKAGKINVNGEEILSTQYETIDDFFNGLAIVSKNNKYGVINARGSKIIPAEYDELYNINIRVGKSYDFFIGFINNDVYYFDFNGTLIGKDMGIPTPVIPDNPTKDDFIRYFDTKLSALAPLEGVYYVTIKNYFEDRSNTNKFGLNDSKSKFYAIVKSPSDEEYWAYSTDGSNQHWVNKFVRIGDTEKYAIIKIDKNNDYSSEGSVTLENPNSFEFRLEQGHNYNYNFFVTYEFVRDYPPLAEIEKLQSAEWTGSGFAIANGYILTNYHVTSGAKNIWVRGINGELDNAYKAVVVASDKEHDLSIIRIVDKNYKNCGDIPYSIGKSMVDVGEEIYILGYPMVASMGYEIKLTEGIISSASGYQGDKSMYQISAAVQPGNSGGPVFNEDGVVIGVVCGKHANTENVNYAIKISCLYSLLNSSNLGIELSENVIREKKLSKKVKKVKNFVYLIECSSI